ncbi:MAG TPA: S1/P1 nuclease [Roseateles sp.]|nr:S1/P1 nuclease [Roseateles sp.]
MFPVARAALAAALALSLSSLAGTVQAWGFEGHRMVASLAEARLSPKARSEVQRLLAQEPGATLASISTWADEIRSPRSGRWHYINFPRGGCRYEKPRDCPTGACIVEALEAQVALLGSDAGDDQRLAALKYVVHLIGDVHQPLHAGYGEDKGGNLFQLRLLGKGRNLHSVWDTGMIMAHAGGPAALAAEIGARLPREAKAQAPAAARWAEESCRLVEAEGFYPASHKIDERYLQEHEATLKARLGLAALRLAAVLNGALR